MSDSWPVEVVPLNPVSCASALWRMEGFLRVTIVVKATFGLVPDGPARMIAPEAKLEKVMEVKGRHDIQACGLSQAIVERLLGSPSFEPRLERLRSYYQQRSERLIAALSKLPGIHFRIPTGGFSVWVETEIPGSDASLLYAALESGVAFDPGELFLAHPEKHPNLCLRLSYSAVALNQIEEGVARLGRALDRSRSFSLAA